MPLLLQARNEFERALGHSCQGCSDFNARSCRYVYRLKAQLRRLEPKALLCAWFAAGSFVERRRRAGDLLRRRARGRQQAVGRFLAALRRGWQQAVVRLLAVGSSDGSVRGHRSGRGFCDFVGKTAGTDLSRGRKGRPFDVIKDFVPSGSPIAGYKEFISRRATGGHFVKANGRFSKANAFVKGKLLPGR